MSGGDFFEVEVLELLVFHVQRRSIGIERCFELKTLQLLALGGRAEVDERPLDLDGVVGEVVRGRLEVFEAENRRHDGREAEGVSACAIFSSWMCACVASSATLLLNSPCGSPLSFLATSLTVVRIGVIAAG